MTSFGGVPIIDAKHETSSVQFTLCLFALGGQVRPSKTRNAICVYWVRSLGTARLYH